MSNQPNTDARIRVWTTIHLSELPDMRAHRALKQARLWDAVMRGLDERFAVHFDNTHSDADMVVVGYEGDLLPIIAQLVRSDDTTGYAARFDIDAPTAYSAERLWRSYGDEPAWPGNWIFASVTASNTGSWELPDD